MQQLIFYASQKKHTKNEGDGWGNFWMCLVVNFILVMIFKDWVTVSSFFLVCLFLTKNHHHIGLFLPSFSGPESFGVFFWVEMSEDYLSNHLRKVGFLIWSLSPKNITMTWKKTTRNVTFDFWKNMFGGKTRPKQKVKNVLGQIVLVSFVQFCLWFETLGDGMKTKKVVFERCLNVFFR